MSILNQYSARPGIRPVVTISLFAVLLAGLACGLPFGGDPTPRSPVVPPTPTVELAPTATSQPLPPGLVESDPPLNGELPLDGPITLFFNQPMDRTSVETALTGQLQQRLSFTWVDDTTVVVYLSQDLSPETALAFELDQNVRSRQGLSLTQPIRLNFQTPGYLQPVQILPEADAREVNPTSAVVVSFNRPIVALGADPAAQPPAFTLEPESLGRGLWLNTSTYIFYPEPALSGGQTYTVRLDPALKSNDGALLQESFSWSFNTASPELLAIEPLTETPWPLNAPIRLTFNQPMDRTSVESRFNLAFLDGSRITGKFSWEEDDSVLIFTPTDLLPRNATINLSLDAQAQALGGTELGVSLAAQVVTVPNFSVTGSEPSPGGTIDPNTGINLNFSSPLPVNQDLAKFVRLEPAVKDLQVSANENFLWIYGNLQASTDYVLKLAPDLADIWGGTLGREYELAFRTNPLQPNLSILTGADAIFLTPQDISLIVQAVNVPEVPMTVGNVPLNDLFALLGINGYQLRQNYQGANQVTWTQTLNLSPDKSQPVQVFLNPQQQALNPGIYFVRLNFDQTPDSPYAFIYGGPYIVVVSNIQLTFKSSATDALVWAVDLRTGAPLPNAPVTLYAEDGSPIAAGQTDSQGVFRATFPARTDPYNPIYAMVGEPGQDAFGMAFSSWTTGIEPWDFEIPVNVQPPGLFVYYYTDRPIYRPGQTVYFRAIARQAFNGRYAPSDIASLPVTVYGVEGRELMSVELPLSAFGSAHGQFDLPRDSQPGYYSISSSAAPNNSLGFLVANYRKPEINLAVAFTENQVQAGGKLSANINARYFFDAPGGNLPLRWALYAGRDFFTLPGYHVGPEDLSWLDAFRYPNFDPPLGELVEEGEAKTNLDGTLALDFLTKATDARQRYTLEVTITDESGLPVSGRASAFANPDSFYIGLRPDAWVGNVNAQLGFDVQTVDWQKRPAPGLKLRAEFQTVLFERQEPVSNDPILLPVFKPRFTLVGSTDFVTSPDGQARLAFVAPEPGTYMLDVYNPAQPLGEGSRSQILLWVGGEGQAIWPNLPNSRLRLVSDRESYRPGDTAQIFIPNPYNTQIQALVTIERGVILEHRILAIDTGGYKLDLPLTDTEAPNVVLSVTLLGRGPQGAPDFRQGYLNLPVEPVAQELKVILLTQPERTGPGDEVQFKIQVQDASGKPVQGEFSLAVVDLAVLALADPNSLDILPAFYGEQPLGVRTSLSLAVYNRRLLDLPLGLGGGGGDEAPSVARERFPDTAYWNAQIVTDANGLATVKITLPDTLTTWQVDTRGMTLDARVGQAQTQIVTTKELLVRPVTPRFFVVNDHVQVSCVVQNNSAQDLQVRVALQAKGFVLDEPGAQSQELKVPAEGRARLEWWGVVQDVEQVDLIFSAEGSDAAGNRYLDAARPVSGMLPVLRYVAPQTFRTAGSLETADEIRELISLPRSFSVSGGGLQVELSPSLASAMIRALDVLESAPFESSEQILSSFLPNLETYRTLQEFGIQDEALKTRLDRALNQGLVRLLARQNFDGGWSWWERGDSDPYVTAYVLFGLHRARLAGISINQNTLDLGIKYLQDLAMQPAQGNRAALAASLPRLPGAPQAVSTRQQQNWEWDRLSFEQFALAQFDKADAVIADQIYEARRQLSPWAQALLVLTLESLSPGSEDARALLMELQNQAIRSATGAYWELSQDEAGYLASELNMQTNLSNSAIVLYVLAQRDPGSPLVTDTVRFLMANRDADGAWASTYTTAWTLIGLGQALKGTGELGGNFSFGALLNGNPIADGAAGGPGQLTAVTAQTPIQRLYPDYPNSLVIERSGGPGRLYYTAGLTVNRLVEEVAPITNGLSIMREIFPFDQECQEQECPPIEEGKVGQKVRVRLTLTLPRDRYYLAVADYIPAGAEILDTNLKTTELGSDGMPVAETLFDPRRPYAGGWGWWLFSQPQIYDHHIAWTADNLPAGTYQLTYTLTLLQPGQFRVPPARAWQLYFPEVQANSAGAIFEIRP